jgi:hypothetical protein
MDEGLLLCQVPGLLFHLSLPFLKLHIILRNLFLVLLQVCTLLRKPVATLLELQASVWLQRLKICESAAMTWGWDWGCTVFISWFVCQDCEIVIDLLTQPGE